MGVMDRKRRQRLPKAATLPAGTRIYHGTRCAGDFATPDGPAWFAFSAEKAREWCDWSSHPPKGRVHAEPRVMAFVVRADVTLLDTRDLSGWQALGMALMGDPDPLMSEIAVCVRDRGHAGWLGGNEVMLAHPGTALSPVPLTPQEFVRVNAVSDEAAQAMDEAMADCRARNVFGGI